MRTGAIGVVVLLRLSTAHFPYFYPFTRNAHTPHTWDVGASVHIRPNSRGSSFLQKYEKGCVPVLSKLTAGGPTAVRLFEAVKIVMNYYGYGSYADVAELVQ